MIRASVESPRSRVTLAWQRGPWLASVTTSYTPPYHTESTAPTPGGLSATGIDGELISSSTRWDLQLGYTVRRDGAMARRYGWLVDTTWTLGVRNVFDREPPARSDGTSFYSRFDDPRNIVLAVVRQYDDAILTLDFRRGDLHRPQRVCAQAQRRDKRIVVG